MFMNMIGDRMTRPKRRRQNKRDLVLTDRITGAFSHARFRSAIGHRLKTERALIKVRRLFGVTDMKFDVIRALERQKIFLCRGGDRKSTRLNSSHRTISYAVFCLKKKK